jgi:hypothetical protein
MSDYEAQYLESEAAYVAHLQHHVQQLNAWYAERNSAGDMA